jgi:hypothetical protein
MGGWLLGGRLLDGRPDVRVVLIGAQVAQPALERFEPDDQCLTLAGLAADEQAADPVDGACPQRPEKRSPGWRQSEDDGAAVVGQAAHPLDQATVLEGVSRDGERGRADFEGLGKLAGAVVALAQASQNPKLGQRHAGCVGCTSHRGDGDSLDGRHQVNEQ